MQTTPEPLYSLEENTMFERFTERARQVVVLAQDEARAMRHAYIGTEHLLVGLLREEEGLAARVLTSMDLTVEEVRVQVSRRFEVDPEVPVAANTHLPFTASAKKVLELALREALSLGHNYIGTEHILLGFMRENVGNGYAILLDFDITPDKVRNEVIRMLSGPGRQKRGHTSPEEREGSPSTWQVNTESEFFKAFMAPIVQQLAEMETFLGSPHKTTLGTNDIQRIGELALSSATTLGLSQEWKQAYADLADAASRLLSLAEASK